MLRVGVQEVALPKIDALKNKKQTKKNLRVV
jgi:hypothetical protein